MRIAYSYQGKALVFDRETTQVVIGRPQEGVAPDLDLTPDQTVSRPHARLWLAEGHYWIEDLHSMRGTQVNGEDITGQGKRRVHADDTIRIGDTTLQVDIPTAWVDPDATRPPDEALVEPSGEIAAALDASTPAFAPADAMTTQTMRQLALLYDLPLQFARQTHLDALFQTIVARLVDVIPGAMRSALLLKDRTTDRLLLRAHMPVGAPAVSMTLAQQAIEKREGFIWQRGEAEVSPSHIEHRIASGMYAPLLWQGAALGVVCVDNCDSGSAFTSDDLQLLLAVAHYAAMAVAHQNLQDSLRSEGRVLDNFQKLVSPRVRDRLQQHRGRIRLGGEFCDVTVLFSDMRGFTRLSATMSPDDVTDMLEDYFGRLVPIISKYGGAIDKYVGDAILAVFDADEVQYISAIRAALGMQDAMQEVNARRAAVNKHTGELGIGIHCGEVVQGFIGAAERMEFTVIGDAVNRASRYCDGARAGEVLMSPEVFGQVFREVKTESTTIATKHEGDLQAYRLTGLKG